MLASMTWRGFCFLSALLTATCTVQLASAVKQNDAKSHAGVVGDDISMVHQRLYQFYLDNGACTQNDPTFCASGGCGVTCLDANQLCSNISADGSWKDINYHDQTKSEWQPAVHMQRMVAILRASNCNACTSAPKEVNQQLNQGDILSCGRNAFDFWLNAGLPDPQWWWEQIGTPGYVTAAAYLLQPHNMTDREHSKAVTIMNRAPGTGSGQNLVWSLQLVIARSAFINDSSALSSAFAKLWSSVQFQTGDGVQQDGSFYQHGPLLQNGAYGGDYMLNLVVLWALSSGTAYEISESAMEVLSVYVLDGEQLMMRWNGETGSNSSQMYWDVAVKGREIVRVPGQLTVNADPLKGPLRATTKSPRHLEFLALSDRMYGNGSHVQASRHFWRTDYFAHRTSSFMMSLHMKSNRTYPTECVNDENLIGWHLGDGATFVAQRGDENLNVFPVWDWNMISGTTAMHTSTGESSCDVKNKGATSFVGGCSNGHLGVAAMDYRVGGSLQGFVSGRKSWFFINEGMACLIANMTAEANKAQAAVLTTLEQTPLRGDVRLCTTNGSCSSLPSGNRTVQATGGTLVIHNNVTFAPLIPSSAGTNQGDTASLGVSNTVQNGSWARLSSAGSNATVSMPVFSAWIDHGVSPQQVAASYTVLPGVGFDDACSAVADLEKRLFVTANTAAQQAVVYKSRDGKNSTVMATFFEPGTLDTAEAAPLTSVQSSQPVVLLLAVDSSQLSFSVANPENAALNVTINVNVDLKPATGASYACNSAGTQKSSMGSGAGIAVQLPGGSLAGSTVLGACQLAST